MKEDSVTSPRANHRLNADEIDKLYDYDFFGGKTLVDNYKPLWIQGSR